MSILIKQVLLDGEEKDVYIEGEVFKKIGKSLDVKADYVISGKDRAIIPSFFNVHTHAAMTLLRGYADDMDLHTWLSNYIWPFERKLTPEDVYIGTKLACLEMIKTGTTFFCDMYWHVDAIAQAVDEMGIRAALSSAYVDFEDPKKGEYFQKRNREFFDSPPRVSSRIKFIMGPHAIYTVSKESLKWIRDFARERDLFINIHVAETKKEMEDCLKIRGTTPVRYLEDIGFLNERCILAHVIWVDDQEIEILKNRNVKIAHVPASNMKLTSGSFRFDDIIGKGVMVGMGTDGCASNNNLDMLEEMKIAALRAKMASNNPSSGNSEDIFRCATINGARIFGIDAGEILEGKLADCVLIDLNHPQMVPCHNLVSNLVYSSNGDVVTTTICNGRILMENRYVKGEEEIIKKTKKQVKSILDRL
ncbi:amidohydrolase [Desulfothermus okinawensis JCM 13304]